MKRLILLVLCGLMSMMIGRSYYCTEKLIRPFLTPAIEIEAATPQLAQQQVLRKFLEKQSCCRTLEVWYRYKENGHLINRGHVAYFDVVRKELRIELDIGSGWLFGWNNVDAAVMARVLREGGEFSLFTNYCPFVPTSPDMAKSIPSFY